MPAQNITLTANGTQTINSYLQTVKVRYENGDGTYTEYENEINENYEYGQEVSWSKEETDIYESASIETYTVTEAKTAEITINRKTYTITLNKGTGIENVFTQGTFRAGQEITINAEVSEGYIWTNWTNGENEITEKEYTFQMPAENTIYTANATLNTNIPYTVKHWQENLDTNKPVNNSENNNLDNTTNVGAGERADVRPAP